MSKQTIPAQAETVEIPVELVQETLQTLVKVAGISEIHAIDWMQQPGLMQAIAYDNRENKWGKALQLVLKWAEAAKMSLTEVLAMTPFILTPPPAGSREADLEIGVEWAQAIGPSVRFTLPNGDTLVIANMDGDGRRPATALTIDVPPWDSKNERQVLQRLASLREQRVYFGFAYGSDELFFVDPA